MPVEPALRQPMRQPPAERGAQKADADRAADRAEKDDRPGRDPALAPGHGVLHGQDETERGRPHAQAASGQPAMNRSRDHSGKIAPTTRIRIPGRSTTEPIIPPRRNPK